jgi:hypothetical protein
MNKVIIRSGQPVYKQVRLSQPGTVLVRTGQEVKVGDVLAEAVIPEKFQVFDIVNHLRINPSRLEQHLKRLNGEVVRKGDVIAQKPGLITRIFRASQDGRIVSLREGRVTLAMGERKLQVVAPIAGTVVELIPGYGAVIGLTGNLVQGVWSNGLNASGGFTRLEFDFNDPQQRGRLPELKDKIVYSDAIITPERFRLVMVKKPAGIILPSLVPGLIKDALKSSIAVMSLNGFGDQEVDPVSLGLLEAMQGQEAFLLSDGEGQPAELIMPGEGGQGSALFDEEVTLKVGSLVRLLGEPYLGSTGQVVDLPERAERFASGLTAKVAVVERQDGTLIRVPVTNLLLLDVNPKD